MAARNDARSLVRDENFRQLAESARTMQSGADQLARSVAGADRSAAGTVRIAASQPISCYVLPTLLARMRLTPPDVQVELVASNAVSNWVWHFELLLFSTARKLRFVTKPLSPYRGEKVRRL
jgi:DNA-binding transcriptional LysR family regulator